MPLTDGRRINCVSSDKLPIFGDAKVKGISLRNCGEAHARAEALWDTAFMARSNYH